MEERIELLLSNAKKNDEKRVRKSKFNPANFGLFVINPKHSRFRSSFFTMSFQKRLNTLEEYITAANEHHDQLSEKNSRFKSMIVGAEYLFKKHHKKQSKQYYSERKKERYVDMLTELSKHTDMIIAPGTICWRGVNRQQEPHYHNEIYFFYKGRVKHYNKTYPHPVDLKYINKDQFKTGAADSPIIKLNGVSIGVEICLDNAYNHLNSKINPNTYLAKPKTSHLKKIDVHLLVADGIKRPNQIAQTSLLFFKVERTSKYKTEIGISHAKNPKDTILRKAPSIPLSRELTYYDFNYSSSQYRA